MGTTIPASSCREGLLVPRHRRSALPTVAEGAISRRLRTFLFSPAATVKTSEGDAAPPSGTARRNPILHGIRQPKLGQAAHSEPA